MFQRILVPVDGSPTSNAGLDQAIAIAKLTGAQVRLVYVVDEMPFVLSAEGYGAMSADVLGLLKDAGAQILGEARRRVEKSGIGVDAKLFENFGRVCDRVVEEAKAWGADLVVLGTHGRRGVSRMLLGSDAEQIVRTAPVPVLLVRGSDASAQA
jgi:nucleotide-binding universal stress UspA family protein